METMHVTFRAPREVIEKIDEEARGERRSRGFIINEILLKHLHENRNGVVIPITGKNGKKK